MQSFFLGCSDTCGICEYIKVAVQSVQGMREEESARIIAHELGHQ